VWPAKPQAANIARVDVGRDVVVPRAVWRGLNVTVIVLTMIAIAAIAWALVCSPSPP
jgi:hypothetical protein